MDFITLENGLVWRIHTAGKLSRESLAWRRLYHLRVQGAGVSKCFHFHAVFRKIIGFCSHLCGIGTPFPSPNPVWEILDLPLISVLSNLSWYYICATYCLVQWNCCHCRFIEEMLFCATSMVVNWRRQTGLGSWTCQTMFMMKTSKWENVSIGKEWEFLFPDFRTLILDT